MPITFKRAGQEAVTLENVSFNGVALDKVTFKRAGQEAVTVFEKVTLISFTIGGATYQAEEGMAWAEWCDSKYNTAGYYVSGTDISGSNGGRVYTNNSLTTPVLSTDAIISGWNYGSTESGGVGN